MSIFNGKFDSVKQEWETPNKFFDKVNSIYNFDIDLAADSNNKKVNNFYNENDDGLSKDWKSIGWLNPPYGNKKAKLVDWIKKAYNDAIQFNSTTVMLIPARTNTKWFRDYCMKANKIYFIIGRPKFGDCTHGLPQPLILVEFSGGREREKTEFLTIEC